MTSQWAYQITHYDESNSWSSTILTSKNIDSIPLFTDQGSGEVNRCIIRLNAANGKFLIDSASTQPYIDQFDKIRLIVIDGLGYTYNRVFEVMQIVPSEDAGLGTIAQIECLGNEWYLQHIHFAKPFWFKNAFEVSTVLGDTYNTSIGSKQPTLVYHDKPYNLFTTTDANGTPHKLGNALPNFNVNVYDYDTSEKPIYDIFMDLIDRQAASVDAGGVLDFFELGFDTSASDLHKIHMRLFSSGIDPDLASTALNPITIDASSGGTTVNTNLDESEGGISAQTATRTLTWGDMGSLPIDYSKYTSGKFDWIFRPDWSEHSIKYLVSARVRYKGNHFKCRVEHTSEKGNHPPSTAKSSPNWENITFMSEIANAYSYSKWTVNLAESWKAMGANYTNAAADAGGINYGQCIWDSNLVINSLDPEDTKKGFKRTWVHSRTNGAPNLYFYDFPLQNGTPPRGFRWLNNVPNISGTDPITGSLYQQSILQYDEDGAFQVFLDPRKIGDKIQVAVLNEAKIYEWQLSTNTWIDRTGDLVKNDCFHPWNTFTNVNGTVALPKSFQEGEKLSNTDPEVLDFTSEPVNVKNYNSALEMTNTYNDMQSLVNGSNYYKAFAGFCFGFPFPFHSKASVSTERVGYFYNPPTLDPRNMNFTSSGNNGFNQSDSEDLGAIESIGFEAWVQFTLGSSKNSASALLVANIPVRVTCYDTEDNVFVSDQIIPFRANWTTMIFPINDFKPYKAHIPIARTQDFISILHPKDLEPAGVFNWRNLKLLSIQIQSFYDEYGRYSPMRALDPNNWLDPQTISPIFGATVTFRIDGLRFNKRNLAMTPKDLVRNIEAPFGQRNDIISYNQLKKDTEAQLEIEKFQHKEVVIGTQGKFDIRFGDQFYYKNPRLVNDKDDGANTIKLVAKKIEYSIIKNNKGKGGLMRKIHGVKRFY